MNTHSTAYCPALFLAAPASGQGKTTITAALARFFKRQGKVVRVFKTGPDYLDPQILAQASGQPVEQLDMWMAGEAYCQQKLFEAAQQADLILVEGVMGIFDGEPSSADLAARFGIPIALVMDVKGMAQTAAAIAAGLANYRDDIHFAGLLANNCGSERHAELIRDALPANLPLLATLKRDPDVALPERHLGLVQADEIQEELEQRFEAGADWIAQSGLQTPTQPVAFHSAEIPAVEPLLKGVNIGIARDAAFSFIYAANVKLLEAMGARCHYFSPMHDQQLPAELDALWLPGGYPELHAEALADNETMRTAIQAFHQSGKPVIAECGGFLYCLQQLTTLDEVSYPMAALIQGSGAMRGKRGCQGMQSLPLPEGEIRGHAHHRSRSADTPEAIAHGKRQRHPAPGEAIYRAGSLTASYLHMYFPSNPTAVARLFRGDYA